MTAKRRCYVASPLGFSEAGRHYYNAELLPALTEVVDPVDPWAGVTGDVLLEKQPLEDQRNAALEIGRRNEAALRSCEMLVAVLDGQEVDSGTAAEVGFAAALGIQCFGLRTDQRQAGEPGVRVNLQIESFIVSSGGQIASSLGELIALLGAAAVGGEPHS
jgi:nucleoside 2-deoxyribosyltransferase